jgi:hypothetical protein
VIITHFSCGGKGAHKVQHFCFVILDFKFYHQSNCIHCYKDELDYFSGSLFTKMFELNQVAYSILSFDGKQTLAKHLLRSKANSEARHLQTN